MQAIRRFSRRPKRLSRNGNKGLSEFAYRVYRAVRKIPKGRVATYGQIARGIGKPGSARAVGNALNRNIFSDVPCHRVVHANGDVGGYAWGAGEKIALLEREKIFINNRRINLGTYGTK